jgi:hypothetical protein
MYSVCCLGLEQLCILCRTSAACRRRDVEDLRTVALQVRERCPMNQLHRTGREDMQRACTHTQQHAYMQITPTQSAVISTLLPYSGTHISRQTEHCTCASASPAHDPCLPTLHARSRALSRRKAAAQVQRGKGEGSERGWRRKREVEGLWRPR